VRAFNGAASVRGIVNPNVAINRSEKWNWISGGTSQSSAGPGDIFFVISSGPFTIGAGETVLLGFALIGGTDLTLLQTHADAAAVRWDEILTLVDVDSPGEGIPVTYALDQNYPNPFNPATTISYDLPEAGPVSLKIYDLLGSEVATLVDDNQGAGRHEVLFDATGLPSGVYFYRLKAGWYTSTRKLVLLR
jgi:hypothetical protein